MAKSPKNGKLPVSTRELMADLDLFDEASVLDVDQAIEKHMANKGMTLRWINATKFKAAGGFSAKGWAPVRTSDIGKEVLEKSGMAFGATAEGFIVRNDLMLACRTKEMTDKHAKQLRAKAALASGKLQNKADAIREGLGRYGKVIEGYDENGDES